MFKRYGLIGSLRLLISLVYTKLFFKKSRLIRLPFDIRNKHLIDLGEGLTTGFGCRIEVHPIQASSKKICIKFGKNVQMNDYVHIAASEKIVIGNNVLLASKIFISDLNHGNYSFNYEQDSPNSIPSERAIHTNPIIIEDNVWIGESVSILGGVIVGHGSIIGCNSVVTKSVPAYCIAAGNPAVIKKKFNFESVSGFRKNDTPTGSFTSK